MYSLNKLNYCLWLHLFNYQILAWDWPTSSNCPTSSNFLFFRHFSRRRVRHYPRLQPAALRERGPLRGPPGRLAALRPPRPPRALPLRPRLVQLGPAVGPSAGRLARGGGGGIGGVRRLVTRHRNVIQSSRTFANCQPAILVHWSETWSGNEYRIRCNTMSINLATLKRSKFNT